MGMDSELSFLPKTWSLQDRAKSQLLVETPNY